MRNGGECMYMQVANERMRVYGLTKALTTCFAVYSFCPSIPCNTDRRLCARAPHGPSRNPNLCILTSPFLETEAPKTLKGSLPADFNVATRGSAVPDADDVCMSACYID